MNQKYAPYLQYKVTELAPGNRGDFYRLNFLSLTFKVQLTGGGGVGNKNGAAQVGLVLKFHTFLRVEVESC